MKVLTSTAFYNLIQALAHHFITLHQAEHSSSRKNCHAQPISGINILAVRILTTCATHRFPHLIQPLARQLITLHQAKEPPSMEACHRPPLVVLNIPAVRQPQKMTNSRLLQSSQYGHHSENTAARHFYTQTKVKEVNVTQMIHSLLYPRQLLHHQLSWIVQLKGAILGVSEGNLRWDTL